MARSAPRARRRQRRARERPSGASGRGPDGRRRDRRSRHHLSDPECDETNARLNPVSTSNKKRVVLLKKINCLHPAQGREGSEEKVPEGGRTRPRRRWRPWARGVDDARARMDSKGVPGASPCVVTPSPRGSKPLTSAPRGHMYTSLHDGRKGFEAFPVAYVCGGVPAWWSFVAAIPPTRKHE